MREWKKEETGRKKKTESGREENGEYGYESKAKERIMVNVIETQTKEIKETLVKR